MAKKITPAERKRQNYLRRVGLKTSLKYETRLLALRAHEVKRVLTLCQDWTKDPDIWAAVIEGNLDERDYLPKWEKDLFTAVGLPMAKSTAKDLNQSKAAADETLWLQELENYAADRAGSNIVIVSGSLRDELIRITREQMEAGLAIVTEDDPGPGISVEKLTKRIFKEYSELAKWQVRRIAQTESMIGMADAAHMAAKTLDIGYTKQWCISGLGNTRDTHQVMDGWEADEDEPFELEGGLLMYPHDCSLGADASEIINCACCCIRRPK